jgi:hypothetical protein
MQWMVLGNDKDIAKEKAWAKKAISQKGVAVHSRSAIIKAFMRQQIDKDGEILFMT